MSLLKKDSLLTHLLIMAGVSLLLIVLLIFGLDLYTHHGETVKVPDLRGKTLAEMQRILDDVGLEYEINLLQHRHPRHRPRGRPSPR